MSTTIYDKSDKGRAEIATRKYQLASRLRTLLVIIDGKQTVDELLKKVAGLGLDEQSIQALLDQEFIQIPHPAEPIMAVDKRAALEAEKIEAAQLEAKRGTEAMTDAQRFQATYKFFNETIKSAIGLRGFALQMKVERASTMEDFHSLRIPYLEAVMKANGNEMARSLGDRLNQLLNPANQKLVVSTM